MAIVSMWSLLFLLSLLHVVISQSRVDPLFYTIGNEVPFNGSSNTSTECGNECFKLTDTLIGPIDSIYDDLGSFFAFSRQSGDGSVFFLLPVAVSRVVLYFFNSPKDSIGLPQITITEAIGDASISFTYDGNDELDQNDSRLRNVSLNLNESSNSFTIYIVFIDSIQIDWCLLSEVEFYNGALVPPSLNLVFQGSPSQVSLGPDDPQSSVSISCTLVNSGSFEWMWEYEGSDIHVDRSEVWIADATRTSILVINELRYTDSGNYACSAKHTTYYNISTQLNLNVALTAAVNNVSARVSDSFVTLSCETFGYLVNGIKWMRNGVELSDGKYSVSTLAGDISSISNNGSSTTSIISQLSISNITEQDDGVYICVIQNTTIQEIITLHILSTVNIPSVSVSTDPFTSEVLVLSSSSSFYSSTLLTAVTNTEGSSTQSTSDFTSLLTSQSTIQSTDISTSQSTDLSTSQSTGLSTSQSTGLSTSQSTGLSTTPSTSQSAIRSVSQTTTSSVIPSASEAPRSDTSQLPIIIGAIVGIVLLIVIINIIVIIIIAVACRRRSLSTYPSSSPSISKEMIEPVPSEPFYSEIDKKPQNFSIDPYSETTFLTETDGTNSPPQKDVVYQEIPEIPQRDSKPPLIDPALLQHNPMYSSSAEIDFLNQHNTMTDFVGSDFNIYARPSLPPPIPDFHGTPDSSIYNASMYSVDLNPSFFKSQESLSREDTASPYLQPYSSVYADPQPILRSDVLEVSEHNVNEIKELGFGQFGKVVLAHTVGISLKDLNLGSEKSNVSILVAIKRLGRNVNDKEREMFEKEVKFMSRLRHENVVKLLGVCLEKNAFIMMEYMENGDMNNYLQNFEFAPDTNTSSRSGFLSVGVLIFMSLQIASGMRYLASLNFVHRDIASRNCLVGQNYIVKIADFGMSRKLYDRNYYRIEGKAVLPIRWMSHECFYGRFSEKTDVWAFGVTLWEIFTFCKRQPYDHFSDQEVVDNALRGDDKILLEQPHSCPDDVYQVMEKCWIHDTEKRTNFEEIHGSFQQIHAYSDMS